LKTSVRKPVPPAPRPFFSKDVFAGTHYRIGDFTYGSPEILHWGEDANLIIGKYCSIADRVKIFLGGNHRIDWVTTYPFNALPQFFPNAKEISGHPATKGDVVIGNDVWIGHGATIMSGVSIGHGAVVAAEAVVSKNIGPYEIWGGNPARFIKKRFDDETIERLLALNWWDWPESEIQERVAELCDTPRKIMNR
jgi:acetyltransferase-like isoleucine patch superfamily enzyme